MAGQPRVALGDGAVVHVIGQAAAIRLTDGELAGFAFVDRDDVESLVTPLLARRVAACLDAAEAGWVVAALENGSPAACG